MCRNSSVESRIARPFSEDPLAIPLFLHTRCLSIPNYAIELQAHPKARLLELGTSTDRGAFWCATQDRQVIAVEIAARAFLPIKYEFILESGWRRLECRSFVGG